MRTMSGYLPIMPVNARYIAGTSRDKQGQKGKKAGTSRDKQGQTGTSRDKQGQTGTNSCVLAVIY